VRYPPLGSLLSKELSNPEASLPGFVSIAPMMNSGNFVFSNSSFFTPGFLAPEYAPLVIGKQTFGFQKPSDDIEPAPEYDEALRVKDLLPPRAVQQQRVDARIELLQDLHRDFVAGHLDVPALSHQAAYARAIRLMRTSAGKAFDLHEEASELRDRYGRNLFGQGCLLARRLVERGVPFVEVTLGKQESNGFVSWDTHNNNFEQVKKMCGILDDPTKTNSSNVGRPIRIVDSGSKPIQEVLR
jgi:Protein of unknown function (DUF1501)